MHTKCKGLTVLISITISRVEMNDIHLKQGFLRGFTINAETELIFNTQGCCFKKLTTFLPIRWYYFNFSCYSLI